GGPETTFVRIERREGRGAADVCDPALSRCQTPGHVPDRRVRHAQQDELRPVLAQLDAALLEARGDRRPDPAATDHVDAFEHLSLQFPTGYRAAEAYLGTGIVATSRCGCGVSSSSPRSARRSALHSRRRPRARFSCPVERTASSARPSTCRSTGAARSRARSRSTSRSCLPPARLAESYS